jgi:hypothetical protein
VEFSRQLASDGGTAEVMEGAESVMISYKPFQLLSLFFSSAKVNKVQTFET